MRARAPIRVLLGHLSRHEHRRRMYQLLRRLPWRHDAVLHGHVRQHLLTLNSVRVDERRQCQAALERGFDPRS
jgi:hypothetical protein